MWRRLKVDPNYADVSVDRRWHHFIIFLAEMGHRPEGMSLDRIDPARGYYKGNCRWATKLTQNRNRRNVSPQIQSRCTGI